MTITTDSISQQNVFSCTRNMIEVAETTSRNRSRTSAAKTEMMTASWLSTFSKEVNGSNNGRCRRRKNGVRRRMMPLSAHFCSAIRSLSIRSWSGYGGRCCAAWLWSCQSHARTFSTEDAKREKKAFRHGGDDVTADSWHKQTNRGAATHRFRGLDRNSDKEGISFGGRKQGALEIEKHEVEEKKHLAWRAKVEYCLEPHNS